MVISKIKLYTHATVEAVLNHGVYNLLLRTVLLWVPGWACCQSCCSVPSIFGLDFWLVPYTGGAGHPMRDVLPVWD